MDAVAPKHMPGMGTYAAKVSATGLDRTAAAIDVVDMHPSFAAAEEELHQLELDEKAAQEKENQ